MGRALPTDPPRFMPPEDPVCGMAIEESKAAATATATNRDAAYCFCCESCKAKFLRDLDRYAGADTPATTKQAKLERAKSR